MTTITAAQLPADVETLMRGLRLPHARAIAADVLATARAQRWDPTEVIKALLTEEAVAGPARCWPPAAKPLASRPAKPSTPGTRRPPRSCSRPNRRCKRWNGWVAGRTWWSAARPHRQDRSSSGSALGQKVIEAGMPVAWFTRADRSSSEPTAPMIPWARPSPRSCAPNSSSSMTSDCSGRCRCRRRALPHRRSRLRTPLGGDLVEPSPQRVR